MAPKLPLHKTAGTQVKDPALTAMTWHRLFIFYFLHLSFCDSTESFCQTALFQTGDFYYDTKATSKR